MEKHHYGFWVICSVTVSLGFLAFLACIAAEFKKTKVEDMKLDGKLCYLPGSPAVGLGIAASICLSIVQILGTSVICRQFWSRQKKTSGKSGKRAIAISLLVLSWISFGFAIILLGAASSMNRRQTYGRGWLDGECYVVKNGVYIGSAILVLVTVIFILGSIFVTRRRQWRKQMEQGRKTHAHAQQSSRENDVLSPT